MKKLIILICLLVPSSAMATSYFSYGNDSGVVGNTLTSSTDGPYLFEYQYPGASRVSTEDAKYQNASAYSGGGTYVELTTYANMGSYDVNVRDLNGDYGGPFIPDTVSITEGVTYYFGGKFRYERIGGNAIWHDTWDYNKLFSWAYSGSSFRWFIDSGYGDSASTYYSDRFVFSVGCSDADQMDNVAAQAPSAGWPYFPHDASGYSKASPKWSYYERWYSVVIGILASQTNNGRIRMWINGELVNDRTQRTWDTSSATLRVIDINSTIGQPDYDAPAHKFQFDDLVLTDSWSDITAAGLDQDPEGGTTTTTTTASMTGISCSGVTIQ